MLEPNTLYGVYGLRRLSFMRNPKEVRTSTSKELADLAQGWDALDEHNEDDKPRESETCGQGPLYIPNVLQTRGYVQDLITANKTKHHET